jgi:hypothetical protein
MATDNSERRTGAVPRRTISISATDLADYIIATLIEDPKVCGNLEHTLEVRSSDGSHRISPAGSYYADGYYADGAGPYDILSLDFSPAAERLMRNPGSDMATWVAEIAREDETPPSQRDAAWAEGYIDAPRDDAYAIAEGMTAHVGDEPVALQVDGDIEDELASRFHRTFRDLFHDGGLSPIERD